MHSLLELTSAYAKKWRFKFNQKKSNVMVFGDKEQKKEAEREKWKLGEREIEMTESYKYLGIEVSNNNRLRWKEYIERVTTAARKRANMLRRNGCSYGLISVEASRHLFRSMVVPIWEYGTELWYASKHQLQDLENIQGEFALATLGLSQRASYIYGVSELALKSISCRIDELIMRWYDRLVRVMKESPNRLISIIFREKCDEIDAGKAEMSSLRRVKEIMQKYNNGMSWFDREIDMNDKQWKKKVKQQTDEEDRKVKQQQQQQHHQLHLYTHLFPPTHLRPQPWLASTHNLGGMHVKLQLRSDTLPLRTTLARWKKEEEKICECCDMDEEEDRNHFLLKCKLYGSGTHEVSSTFFSPFDAPQYAKKVGGSGAFRN
jgi:hypothetical protein